MTTELLIDIIAWLVSTTILLLILRFTLCRVQMETPATDVAAREEYQRLGRIQATAKMIEVFQPRMEHVLNDPDLLYIMVDRNRRIFITKEHHLLSEEDYIERRRKQAATDD